MKTITAYVIDDDGFTFGMDSVTPVSWRFTSRQLSRGIYCDWTMPEYMRSWCKIHPTWIGSRAELLRICARVKGAVA